MLGKIFQSLYNKIFINIVVERSKTIVYVESVSNKGVTTDSDAQFFDTIDLNDKMLEYIKNHIKASPYFYISILDTSATQGAIPTCNKHRMPEYYYDIALSKHKCHNNKWAYYTSKDNLYAIERKYKTIGLDFIFSPFTIVAVFFKDKIATTMAMFIFIQDSYLSLTIFDNEKLLFAEHLDMQTENESNDIMLQDTLDEEDVLLDDDGIDLDELEVVDNDDGDDGDDFGNIEDLDALEDIEEFADSKDLEEEFIENAEEISTNSETTIQDGNEDESFTEDYQRFLLIQSSLGKYYKNSLYKSEFVENVYIADGIGVGTDLKKYLEEEMFLNVYIRKLDIAVEVCELAKTELQ